ncbi:MAG: ATP-binding protein [Clostridia bacterium]|nr:ATP-binding protein [Clostridia bacterium]
MGYSREIYRKAEEELTRRRQRSFMDAEKRRDRIYTELPQVRTLEAKLARTGVAAARAVFAGSDTKAELENLRNENLRIQNEIRRILGTKSYIPSDLEEVHSCPYCKDKGYIDGKMCSCMKALLRDTAFEEFNKKAPFSLEKCSFDNFSLHWYPNTPNRNGKIPRKRMERILEYCRDYAERFSPGSESILMEGATGLGKTHLSLAIAGRVIDRGYGVIYGSAPDLLMMLKAENSYYNTDHTVIESLERCDLLIIDDLGTEFPNSFTKSAAYNLLNARLAREKATIVNTNLSMSEMKKNYSDRLVSRLVGDNEYLPFIGEDVRIAKKRMSLED